MEVCESNEVSPAHPEAAIRAMTLTSIALLAISIIAIIIISGRINIQIRSDLCVRKHQKMILRPQLERCEKLR